MACLQLEGSPSTRSVEAQIVLSLVLCGTSILVHQGQVLNTLEHIFKNFYLF